MPPADASGRQPYLAAHRLSDGDGPQLVFLHALGACTSGRYAGELAELLAAAVGAGVTGIDAPGFGDSPPLPPAGYAVPAYAGLTADVLATLGPERPLLAGHSWGGVVACHVAAHAPGLVSGLILLDAGHVDYPDVVEDDLAAPGPRAAL